jgi:hypothetical protein
MPNGPSQNLNRRNMLRLGACGLSSLCLPGSPVEAAIRRGKGKAKRVLIIFEQGGMSQMDTWDPKPDAPSEHRSPFAPISTKVPGIQVSELLKKTAKHIDKLAIVRCMTRHQRLPRTGLPICLHRGSPGRTGPNGRHEFGRRHAPWLGGSPSAGQHHGARNE